MTPQCGMSVDQVLVCQSGYTGRSGDLQSYDTSHPSVGGQWFRPRLSRGDIGSGDL